MCEFAIPERVNPSLWSQQTAQFKFVTTPENVLLGASLKQKLKRKLGEVRFGTAWEDGQKSTSKDLVAERAD